MADRPIRLTLPSADVGFRDIKADGLLVGFATANYYWYWTATLLAHADDLGSGYTDTVTRASLGELRDALRERLDGQGPWWKVPATSGDDHCLSKGDFC